MLENETDNRPTLERNRQKRRNSLISRKKAVSSASLKFDFGELVNLLASGEMILTDTWQPTL
jgi:hypothetical protein